MANRQHFGVQSTKSEVKLVHGSFVGAAAASPTVVAGAVASVVRSGAGTLAVTLTDSYTEFVNACFVVVGPTGLLVDVTAQALTSSPPTISLQLKTGNGTGTDATTGDTLYMTIEARNGG
jgi:hypothetical protein